MLCFTHFAQVYVDYFSTLIYYIFAFAFFREKKILKSIIKTKFLIVGASYAGSLLAAEFAEYGHTLLVDKAVPGERMNCGGGMPEKTFKKLQIDIPYVHVNRILMNINGKDTAFPCKYVVVDRRNLNEALFEKALSSGAKFARMSYFEHHPEKKTALFKFKSEFSIVEYEKLIFADGFHPGRIHIPQKHQNIESPAYGAAKVQIIEGETPYPDTLYFKITDDNPVGYSWVFPMPDKKINIGAGGFQNGKVPDSLIGNLKSSENLDGKVLVRGGGVLPVKPLSVVQDGNTYLFGDAAGMVYALNGEGLKHIADISKKWAKTIIAGKNLNLKWRVSSTYFKLRFASIALKGILAGSKVLGRPLYPSACRAAARSRRIIKM